MHGAVAGERANGGAYAACGSGSLIGFSGRKLAAQDSAACAANGHACAGAAAVAPTSGSPTWVRPARRDGVKSCVVMPGWGEGFCAPANAHSFAQLLAGVLGQEAGLERV